MKKIGISLVVTLACLGLAAAAASKKEATTFAPPDLKWVEVPSSGGVQAAPLRGDMAKGAHAVMVKFPAGAVHPLHTHTQGITIVTVSGTFTYGPEGGPEKSYGPGSYIMIPGGTRHTSGCTSAAPCVLYHEAPGKFDMKMVGTAAK